MLPSDTGIYFLLLYLPLTTTLTIRGKSRRMPRGWYVYTGSAQRHLARRLARHRRIEKRHHWHIDYLRDHTTLVAVVVLPGLSRDDEVAYARAWCACADRIPVAKFGASDSPAPAHLVWFRSRARVQAAPVWNEVKKSGLLIDSTT